MNELIQKLEAERKKRKWTVYRLRKTSGIAMGTYENWIKGAIPKLDSLLKVANALDLEIRLIERKR